MLTKKGRPRKRAALEMMVDVGFALRESQHAPAQSDQDLEMERLRHEIQKLREEVVRGKSQTSSATSPVPAAPLPGRAIRRRLDEEEISL